MPMPNGYNARKAAHAAAFFAIKSGGQINVLKLAKLLYLAERECMSRFDEPMFYDFLVSMDHGPVTSVTLNAVNGLNEIPEWTSVMSHRAGYDIGLVAASTAVDDLDELSRADVQILEYLWTKFGRMNQFQIRDFTHEACKEWRNPNGSSIPIAHRDVFAALGKANPDALAGDIENFRRNTAKIDAYDELGSA